MAIPTFNLARALGAGETVFSGWCSLPYPIVAEMIGREGFAAVTLEAQHGMVRVPVGDFALVSRALDFGAEGIIAPMINTAADARAFAAAAKYPPVGERSWGPHRVTSLAGLTDQSVYLREANDNVIALAMIETRTALANLQAIVETPGIDGLFLGPSDLSIALSDGKSLDPLSKDVERELDRIVAACEQAGKVPGAFCHTAERAAALKKRGMRFLAVMSDIAMLRAGAAAALKVLKG